MTTRPRRVGELALTFGLLVAATGPASQVAAGDALIPGAPRADATFEHLGVLWWIDGDDDLDSSMTLEFRVLGSATWQQGAPAVRAYPTLVVNGSTLGLNYWAASALFLVPGQTYELRMTLVDPDGGGAVTTITATTRTPPPSVYDGNHRYVTPGSGGGDGSLGNPFGGIQAAADDAQAGDVFHISPGTYSPFQVLVSGLSGQPIIFSGPQNGVALIDGGSIDAGIITLGRWDRTISHVVIERMTIDNGRWGIDAQHSRDIVIRHNTITDVDNGVVNRRGDALEARQTVCDNVIVGRVPWPGAGIPSEQGIDLKGDGNVVCHNQVRSFGDCISVEPSTGASYGNDVYGNDVSLCVDDGIEIDSNRANVRVWRNRVMNARMGVSVQPVYGGPAYIFRNEFFNLESVPVKMHNQTTGFLVVHNTGAKHGNGHGDNGSMWRNAVFRNNLFLGTQYAFEFTTVADEGFRDFDYGAWGTTRGTPHFKWDNVRYDTLVDLQAVGVEMHGVVAAFSDLVDAALPPAWDQEATPGSRDLRLLSGAPAVDGGAVLANLNDGFTLNGPPDMGAFELGRPLPHYGPRTVLLFSDSFESGNTIVWSATVPIP
jgi:hypothetical protein